MSSVKLSSNLKQSQREKSFIEDICKRVQKTSTVLYLLKLDNNILGFIALSVSSIGDFPSLQIDYIFVNHAFRGKPLEILDNLKTSDYLVDFAIEIAQEIQKLAGLRYLVLLPDNDKLQNVYKDMGFINLPKQNWLYLKL
ncbi:MAG: GNAT family N-acetyltransferase [Sulfurovum sp.]|nr:GNAT family N-acetyltransferase [Sulfurovum sp.]